MLTRRGFSAQLAQPMLSRFGQGASADASPQQTKASGALFDAQFTDVAQAAGLRVPAVGARVTVRYGGRIQAQEVLSQSSFYSANDPHLHFGLGGSATVDLEIRWPNGGREVFRDVAADQL